MPEGYIEVVEAPIPSVSDPAARTGTVTVVSGPQGLSAYQLAVGEGFEGTLDEWLASLQAEGGEVDPAEVESIAAAAAATVVAAHSADTTDIHGIPDTAALATQAHVSSSIAAVMAQIEAVLLEVQEGDQADQAGLAALTTELAGLTASLATVATTGAYSDLSGKPTIPTTAGQVGADPAGTAQELIDALVIPDPDLSGYATTAALAALTARVTALEEAEPAVDEEAVTTLIDAWYDDAGPFLRGVSQPEDPAGSDPDDPSYGADLDEDFFWYDESTEV